MPAMGVPARKYLPLAEELNKQGFASALFEWRGIETSSVRASRKDDFGYNEILNHDLPEAIKQVRQVYPENPIYILGHSLGGQLGFLLMCQMPEEFEGIVGVATGTPYFKGWEFPNNVGIYLFSKLVRLISASVGHFPGRKFRFAGREARQLMKDWSRTVSSGEYRIEGNPVEFEEVCHQLHKQALMITVDDDVLAPKQSAKNLGDKLSSSEVAYAHLTATDFESRITGHFNWMKEPRAVVAEVKNWINN